jgi:drug/metabolite transporter (DMT)-like permease
MTASLWILFTLIASVGQVARNLMQRNLVATVGTVGATHVRFLYGLPFSVVFYLVLKSAIGLPAPAMNQTFFLFACLGAGTQILATALMLMAMNERSFVVTTAYIKTEPVLVAMTGVLLLGDHLSALAWGAIVVATIGVMLTAWKGKGEGPLLRPALLGVAAGALFGLSAIGFRGAIRELPTESFVLAATTTLVVGLLLQTLVLSLYLGLTNRAALVALARAWRPSMMAGLMGAGASQFWFLAFALESAAKVRTLALVEVLFAGVASGALFNKSLSAREYLGLALILLGVGALLAQG